MKKIISLLLLSSSIFYYGCAGLDKEKCLESVKRSFPNDQIWTEYDGSNLQFIVIDTTKHVVLLIRTENTSDVEITKIIPLKQFQ